MCIAPSVIGFKLNFEPIFDDTTVYTSSMINTAIDDAVLEISKVTFGKYYLKAVYNLAAHFLSIRVETAERALLAPGSTAVSAPRGIMTSATVGDLSETIEVPEYNSSVDDRYLASTQFGQEFLRLKRKMSRGALVVV